MFAEFGWDDKGLDQAHVTGERFKKYFGEQQLGVGFYVKRWGKTRIWEWPLDFWLEQPVGYGTICWDEEIWINENRSRWEKCSMLNLLSFRCLWGDHNYSPLGGAKGWSSGQKKTDHTLIGEVGDHEFKVKLMSLVVSFFFSKLHHLGYRKWIAGFF